MPLKRINLLEGSVRSGKTWISLVKWAMFVRSRPIDELFMMAGKTREALEFNCLGLLDDLTGGQFVHSKNSNIAWLYGRQVRLVGANDESATKRIKGSTLAGAYLDEMSEIPESFYKMTLGRLSVKGAVLIGTTNPDSPSNYVYKEVVTNDNINKNSLKFLIDDNTFLPADYVKNLKQEYTGVFYDRFILGKWTVAEGLIYQMYKECIEPQPAGEASEYVLSIDYGTLNAFSAALYGLYNDTWYATQSYYYSGRNEQHTKTDTEYADDIDAVFGNYGNESKKLKTIIDPSAASFITEMQRRKRYAVRKADNDVLTGIRQTATALKMGYVKISPKIKEWQDEAAGYVWDDKSATDRPLKQADHFCDQLRYFVKTMHIKGKPQPDRTAGLRLC